VRGPLEATRETYDELAAALQDAAPAERLHLLDGLAFRADVSEHSRLSLALAVARFSLDHGELTARAQTSVDDDVAELRALGSDGVKAARERRLSQLERWATDVQAAHPEIETSCRTAYYLAQLRNSDSFRARTTEAAVATTVTRR
jgi:hypothetical protein